MSLSLRWKPLPLRRLAAVLAALAERKPVMLTVTTEEITTGVWVGIIQLNQVEVWRTTTYSDTYAAEGAATSRLISKVSGLLSA